MIGNSIRVILYIQRRLFSLTSYIRKNIPTISELLLERKRRILKYQLKPDDLKQIIAKLTKFQKMKDELITDEMTKIDGLEMLLIDSNEQEEWIKDQVLEFILCSNNLLCTSPLYMRKLEQDWKKMCLPCEDKKLKYGELPKKSKRYPYLTKYIPVKGEKSQHTEKQAIPLPDKFNSPRIYGRIPPWTDFYKNEHNPNKTPTLKELMETADPSSLVRPPVYQYSDYSPDSDYYDQDS
jgi:hypothetical protein